MRQTGWWCTILPCCYCCCYSWFLMRLFVLTVVVVAVLVPAGLCYLRYFFGLFKNIGCLNVSTSRPLKAGDEECIMKRLLYTPRRSLVHYQFFVITIWLCISCAAVDEDRIMASFTDIKDDFLSRPFDRELCEVNVMDSPPSYNIFLLQYAPKPILKLYCTGRGVDHYAYPNHAPWQTLTRQPEA